MKLKKPLSRIPRPVWACLCVILSIVLLLSYYVMLGCPMLTMKQHFRRAEKVHMVGPSKIVDVLDEQEYNEFVRMYVGESEHGVSFFGKYYNSHPYDNPFDEVLYYFYHTEKTGDMTLCVAPNVWGSTWGFYGFEQELPVYLFAENSNAARAELKITVKGSSSRNAGEQFNAHFPANADRTEDGFFRFYLKADQADYLEALYMLSSAISGTASHGIWGKDYLTEISANIRLYDTDGKLISEESKTLFTAQ